MRKIEKPWGYEIIWAETDRYAGKKLFIKQGKNLSRQYHETKDETIYVLDGHLKVEIGHPVKSVLKLGPGTSFHFKPKDVHRMMAISDVILCEVSTPELDDVVRIEDDYGRA